MMTRNFENIPLDDDTQILLSSQMKFGELDCVFQIWTYDAIQGNSLIFYADDLQDKSDEELKTMILTESEIVSNKSQKLTISKNNDEHPFVFVNFDFKTIR